MSDPASLDLQLRRLEATPGDLIVLTLPDKVGAGDAFYLNGLIIELRRAGYMPIVLTDGDTIEALNDESLARIGLRRA